ncbi:hypothetical protein QYF36_020058 [Acer negundo]|nr:hypothetical protein QYF36_020058 [Acer negundo]
MDEVADTAPHDESAAVESSLQLPVESSHNTSDVTSKTLKFSESITDSKCINQLGVIHDDVQESVKTAMNPLVSMSDADAQNKEISDHGVSFTMLLGLLPKALVLRLNQKMSLFNTTILVMRPLRINDAKVTAGCCTTYTKCINQLDVAYDDVQGNDKTVTNPLGFVSDAGEENKEFNDCEVELRRASKLATKSISKVESEDVIVKQNNVGDKASVHHLVENNATDVQNLDLLQESKDDAVVTSGSCKTAVSQPEEESCSLDGNPTAGRSQMNNLGSDSQEVVTRATAEAIILSNQAS